MADNSNLHRLQANDLRHIQTGDTVIDVLANSLADHRFHAASIKQEIAACLEQIDRLREDLEEREVRIRSLENALDHMRSLPRI